MAGTALAVKPFMREQGKGQGWLLLYLEPHATPRDFNREQWKHEESLITSSPTPLPTAISNVSPNSTNPANKEYRPRCIHRHLAARRPPRSWCWWLQGSGSER